MWSSCKLTLLECHLLSRATSVIWIMVFYWLDMGSMALPLFVSHTTHTGSSRIHGVQCGETMATTRFAMVMVSALVFAVTAVSVATDYMYRNCLECLKISLNLDQDYDMGLEVEFEKIL
ncbi:unnamed protein product [Sphagnum troendelagicum]|uniref:CASP-like protein n=1 Tax=Sphagnum troendelagicum TaxID=128251 RepID=A0ABP0UK66_9BRYO